MADLLREQAHAGVPVLFSSHQLDLVERLCDSLVILASGRVVASGTAEALRHSGRVRHRLVLGGDAGWVRDLGGVTVLDVDGPTALLQLASPDDTNRILTEALRRGTVRELAEVVPTVSEIYREVTA
jgi:ABC-2 type transport system ATP-binding protein